MPYIKQERRAVLDKHILELSMELHELAQKSLEFNLSNEEFLSIAGDINYSFTSVLVNLLGLGEPDGSKNASISYSKIAIATGILENVKQELYRRVASPYEDVKCIENGEVY